MKVEISYETERGCGFRKPSKDGVGIYLRGVAKYERCERLPFLLDVCPCCGSGFSPTRGFTWIDPMTLFNPETEPRCTDYVFDGLVEGYRSDPDHNHKSCWMCNPELLGNRAGLIWIGEQHYKSPQDFTREAELMGISRKVAAIPNGFRVGEDAIFLAHRKAIYLTAASGKEKIGWQPGVFASFKPTHVELVIDDPDAIPNKAIEIAKRLGEGKVKIVKVIPDTEEEVSEWEGEYVG